jgi:hypothetical protein
MMARKSLADIDPKLKSVVEEFKATSLVKYEMAMDAYNLQDKETRAVIDRIVATLQQYATGFLNVKVGSTYTPIKIDNDYLGYNLLYLAVEVVKDLAFLQIKVANFVFPPSLCYKCGAEVIPETRKGK